MRGNSCSAAAAFASGGTTCARAGRPGPGLAVVDRDRVRRRIEPAQADHLPPTSRVIAASFLVREAADAAGLRPASDYARRRRATIVSGADTHRTGAKSTRLGVAIACLSC